MATARERRRCRERLERLSGSGLDCDSLRREAVADLQRVIGFDRWCWPLADPESLLPASGIAQHDYVSAVSRSLELEYSTDRFAAKHLLARRADAAASMSAETHGDLSRSTRWDEAMRPVGIGDVATVACRDALGCWGWIEAYRDRSDPSFEDDDLELLASIAPSLGSALRRTMYADGPSATTAAPHGPGVIVLDAALAPISSTAAARAWLDTFPDAPMLAAFGMLPAVIYPAAATARSGTAGAGTQAIVQSVDRRWVMIEAAKLEGGGDQIAVTLRAATAAERFGLLCRAYALTRRERQVVAALLAGLDTHAITERLFISAYTVQDHLKSVFAKTGVRSRRELLARFSGSFEPGGSGRPGAERPADLPLVPGGVLDPP